MSLPITYSPLEKLQQIDFSTLHSIPLPSEPFIKEQKKIQFGFSKADQRLIALQTKGICDEKGVPLPSYSKKNFSSLVEDHKEDFPIIERIHHHLKKSRQLDSRHFDTIGAEPIPRLEAYCSLIPLFSHLTDYSLHPPTIERNGSLKPIEEIFISGRTGFELLQAYPLTKSAKEIFTEVKEDIDRWFAESDLQKRLRQMGSDDDFQVLTQSDTAQLLELRDTALDSIGTTMTSFDENLYLTLLKQKKSHYQNLKTNEVIKRLSLLEFGGVTNRQSIFNGVDSCCILSFKIKDQKGLDILFIQSLKKDHFFSSDSLKIPIQNFLSPSPVKLDLHCGPFSPAKFLIDLMCGISTIFKRHLIDKSHALRYWRVLTDYGERFTQEGLENEIIQALVNFKREYLRQKSPKKDLTKQVSEDTDSYYYYSLISNWSKHHESSPSFLIAFTFNACQSLKNNTHFSDQKCEHLFQLLNAKGLLEIEPVDTPNFWSVLKKALLVEKIPFSQLSAWLEILSFIFYQTSLTTHENQPVFNLTIKTESTSYFLRLPFKPEKALQSVLDLLSQSTLPPIYYELFQTLIPIECLSPTYPSPLTPYTPSLGLNLQLLSLFADAWIAHADPLISYLGLNLHLAIPTFTLNQSTFYQWIEHLPKILQLSKHETLEHLKAAIQHSSLQTYIPLLTALEDHFKSPIFSFAEAWIRLLSQFPDPYLLFLSHQLFEKKLQDQSLSLEELNDWKKVGLLLLNRLSSTDPSRAWLLFKQMKQRECFSLNEEVQEWLHLGQLYQRLNIGKKGIFEIQELAQMIFYFIDHVQLFQQKNQSYDFSAVTAFLIQSLYQDTSLYPLGDELLFLTSRQGLLKNPHLSGTWIHRLDNLVKQEDESFLVTTASLYRAAKEEGYLKSLDSQQSHRLKAFEINLGRWIFQKNKSEAVSALDGLWQNLFKESQCSSSTLFKDYLLYTLQKEINSIHINLQTFQLLETTTLIAAPSHRNEVKKLLEQFLKSIKSYPTLLQMNEDLKRSVDQWLIRREIQALLRTMPNWLDLYLDYLEISLTNLNPKRLFEAWKVLDVLLKQPELFQAEDRNTIRMTRPFLQVLNEHRLTTLALPGSILKWLTHFHSKVIESLKIHKEHQALYEFLKVLKDYAIPRNTGKTTLWICQALLENPSEKSIPQALELLTLEPLSTLAESMQEHDWINLEAVVFSSSLYQKLENISDWIIFYFQHRLPEAQTQMWKAQLRLCVSQSIEQNKFHVASHLLLVLPYEGHQDISFLWLKILKGLQENSKNRELETLLLDQRLLNYFGSSLDPLKEIVIPYLLQLFSAHSSVRFDFIIQLIHRFDINHDQIWCALFNKLNDQDSQALIEKAWNLFKAKENQLAEIPRCHCWIAGLKMLKSILHSDLVNYIFDNQRLNSLFLTKETTSLKLECEWHLLLGCIVQLDLHQPDPRLLKQILIKRNLLLSSLDDNQRWEIDSVLIKRLKSSLTSLPLLIDLLENLLRLKICPKNWNQLIEAVEKMSVSYALLQDKSGMPYTDFLTLLKTACKEFLPTASYRKLIKELAPIPCPEALKQAITMSQFVLENTQPKDLKNFKKIFQSLMESVIKQENAELILLINSCLDKGWISMGMTPQEYAGFYGTALNNFFTKQLETPQNENATDSLLNLYFTLAPKIFPDPLLTRAILNQALKMMAPYGQFDSQINSDKPVVNPKKFQNYLNRLLEMPKEIPPVLKKNCEESILSFMEWTMEETTNFSLLLQPKLTLPIFSKFILNCMGHKNFSPEVLVRLIMSFSFLYPPVFNVELVSDSQLAEHHPLSKELFLSGFKKHIFAKFPVELVELCMYYNEASKNVKALSLDIKIKAAQKLFRRLMKFNTNYSLYVAVAVLKLMYKMAGAKELETFAPLYLELTEKCKQFPRFFTDEKKQLTLLSSLIEVLGDEKTEQYPLKTRLLFMKIYRAQYEAAFQIAGFLKFEQKDHRYFIEYIRVLWSLLGYRRDCQEFKNYSLYKETLDKFLPLMEEAVFPPFSLEKGATFFLPDLDLLNLASFLVSNHFESLRVEDQVQQRQFFVYWLKSWQRLKLYSLPLTVFKRPLQNCCLNIFKAIHLEVIDENCLEAIEPFENLKKFIKTHCQDPGVLTLLDLCDQFFYMRSRASKDFQAFCQSIRHFYPGLKDLLLESTDEMIILSLIHFLTTLSSRFPQNQKMIEEVVNSWPKLLASSLKDLNETQRSGLSTIIQAFRLYAHGFGILEDLPPEETTLVIQALKKNNKLKKLPK